MNILAILFLVVAIALVGLMWFYFKMRKSLIKKTQQNNISAIKIKELQVSEAQKSKFFANIVQELSTPIASLQGPIQSILSSSELSIGNREMMEKIKLANKELQFLINAILDVSNLQNKVVELQASPLNLFHLVYEIFSSFEEIAESRNLRLVFKYRASKDLQLMLDKVVLEKVLINLISSAINYTELGGSLYMEVIDFQNRIQIQISNKAEGIHQDKIKKIFEGLKQAKIDIGLTQGSSNIGLALSEALIRQLNGKIAFKTELGLGSEFVIELPRDEVIGSVVHQDQVVEIKLGKQSEEEQLSDVIEEPNEISKMESDSNNNIPNPTRLSRILIVEDNLSIIEYLSVLFSNKYDVLTAINGQSALDQLQKTNVDFLPDLILSDVMMPVMDGFELLKAVKTDPSYAKIPFIMLTARIDINDKLDALRIGVDDYIFKPFEEEELLTRIESLIENAEIRKSADRDMDDQEGSTILSEDQRWLEHFERYLMENINNELISTMFLSREFAMSESTLLRQLKRLTGLTPLKYVEEIRLNRARQIIDNQIYNSVSRVAQEVGYKNARTFSRNFKKRFGKLPSEYLNI